MLKKERVTGTTTDRGWCKHHISLSAVKSKGSRSIVKASGHLRKTWDYTIICPSDYEIGQVEDQPLDLFRDDLSLSKTASTNTRLGIKVAL